MRRHTLRWLLALVAMGFALVLSAAGPSKKSGDITGTLTGNKKYLKGAIVYVEKVKGKQSAPSKPVTMDQKNHKFIPQVLPIVRGTTVRFLNSDPEAHNVFSPDNEGYDLGNWNKGEHRDRKFKKEGLYTQLCKLHPSMIGYVLALQNPYFTVADEDGSFVISDVPSGKYKLKVWQARGAGGPVDVVVKAGDKASVEIEVGKRRK